MIYNSNNQSAIHDPNLDWIALVYYFKNYSGDKIIVWVRNWVY